MIRLSSRTALLLALIMSLLLNLMFLLMFFYGRNMGAPDIDLKPIPVFSSKMFITNALFDFVLAFSLYILNFKLLKLRITSPYKYLFIIVLSIIGAFIISYLFSIIHGQVLDITHHHSQDLLIRQNPVEGGVFKVVTHSRPFIFGIMMRSSFILILTLLSSQLLHIYLKQQKTLLENKTLIAENIRTRFEALKNQVNPHFLFNSLNTLNSLIKIDSDKAQDYISQLSNVLRYTLQNKEIISLEEELKFGLSYFNLMQIRYGESLQMENHIDLNYNDYQIIPLSLQILIENAIKHNVITKKNPFVIKMEIDKDSSGECYCVVSNPIIPKKEFEAGEGIGLANLAERYRLMWKMDISVLREDNVFVVKIPINK